MASHLIYSTTRNKNVPIGFSLGDIFLSATMCSINPFANSVQLRVLREEDQNHKHLLELSHAKQSFTLKVIGRFDIGSLMGFSGMQCFHFSMKTWLVLYVNPRIIANGNEKLIRQKNQHHFLVHGDVRLVADQFTCNIYLLRGYLYDNEKLCAVNMEHSFKVNVMEFNKMTDCNWINVPPSTDKEQVLPVSKYQSTCQMGAHKERDNRDEREQLWYIGILKKNDVLKPDPIALIVGTIHRAPFEPYRFGKSKCDFELSYVNSKHNVELIEKSAQLITINAKDGAFVSIYSTSGHGVTVCTRATAKVCGQLLVVDNRDGSLIRRLDGRHVIDHLSGHLKIYVCDENIIVLDNNNRCFQIDDEKSVV